MNGADPTESSEVRYRVMGADQQEYGPVSAEFIRSWIGQRRLNAASMARTDSEPAWRPLSSFSEFAPLLSHPLPAQPPPVASSSSLPLYTGMATTGLVLGIVSVVPGFCCLAGFPFNVAGAALSSVALYKMKPHPDPPGRGAAMAGLLLSLATLAAGLILFCLALLKEAPPASGGTSPPHRPAPAGHAERLSLTGWSDELCQPPFRSRQPSTP